MLSLTSLSYTSTGAPCLVKQLEAEIITDQPDEICEETFQKLTGTPFPDNGESAAADHAEAGCLCFTKLPRNCLKKFKYTAERFNEDQGECDQELLGNNILHLAVSFNKEKTARAIFEAFPELMFERIETTGILDSRLTPFHIAIATCPDIVPDMIQKAEGSDELQEKLTNVMTRDTQEITSTDSTMKGTVLMGQLPFHTAVLSLIVRRGCKADIGLQDDENEDDSGKIPYGAKMLDILENAGADMTEENYLGDTFLHSIMRFVYCFPLEEKKAINVMKYLIRRRKGATEQADDGYASRLRTIIFKQNKEHATALQLAVKYGHAKIFQYLIKQEGLYHRKVQLHDDVYQIRRMDITEFDKVTMVSQPFAANAQQSVIELLCCLSLGKAINMVKSDVFEKIIERKWRHYQRYFYLAFVFHVFFLVWLSVYAVAKAHAKEGYNPIFPEPFLLVTQICSMIISVIYLLQEVIFRIIIARQPFAWSSVHHNVVYRVCTLLFSILLFGDGVINFFIPKHNDLLIVALIIGTWNILFFLRVFTLFSVYVVLINEALVKMVLPFVVLICTQVLIFTVGMHATFLLPNDLKGTVSDFETYGKSFLFMGKLMVGMYDFDGLLESRDSVVVLLLYGAFIFIAFILLINALIAVMTNRFSSPQGERIYVWYIQLLSIIVFMEAFPFISVFAVTKDEMAVRFKGEQKEVKDGKRRYIMSYRTIHHTDADNPSGMIHKLLKDFNTLRSAIENIADGLEDVKKMAFDLAAIRESMAVITNKPRRFTPLRSEGSRSIHVYHYKT